MLHFESWHRTWEGCLGRPDDCRSSAIPPVAHGFIVSFSHYSPLPLSVLSDRSDNGLPTFLDVDVLDDNLLPAFALCQFRESIWARSATSWLPGGHFR